MVILGIDPGKHGGLCFWNDSSGDTYPMPMRENEVDVCRLQELIIQHDPEFAFLEQQQSRARQQGQGVIMQNFGMLLATLRLCDIPTAVVTPQMWQGALGLSGDKAEHIRFAEMFVNIPYTAYNNDGSPRANASLHDGIADAVCIARYGLGTVWGIL
jgi:hypothetical protein